ncbi:MAG: hypothetical protein Tsb0027_05160 [Wenzhouxiangellaceae bacterium]
MIKHNAGHCPAFFCDDVTPSTCQQWLHKNLARIIHETDYCDASSTRICGGSFGRETPQLQALAASRDVDA